VTTLFQLDGKPLEYVGNWSFSSLKDFEECKFRFALAKIHKLPKPALPPNNPLERGTRIHDHLEKFIKSEHDNLFESEARGIKEFEEAVLHLRDLYSEGKATAEQDWLFDDGWDLTFKNVEHAMKIGYDDVDPASITPIWLWTKLDFCVTCEDTGRVVVGDYKSGKSAYKEMEHMQQLQIYSAVAALKYEWADTIIAELWYMDEGHVRPMELTREQALKYVGRFDRRARAMYAERVFKPNPHERNCRFCPFGKRNGTGVCPVAI
jgi:RecB family exonuclease